jgi:hypothetical protein
MSCFFAYPANPASLASPKSKIKELNKEAKNDETSNNEEVSNNELKNDQVNDVTTESDKREPDTTSIDNINTNINESVTNITDI